MGHALGPQYCLESTELIVLSHSGWIQQSPRSRICCLWTGPQVDCLARRSGLSSSVETKESVHLGLFGNRTERIQHRFQQSLPVALTTTIFILCIYVHIWTSYLVFNLLRHSICHLFWLVGQFDLIPSIPSKHIAVRFNATMMILTAWAFLIGTSHGSALWTMMEIYTGGTTTGTRLNIYLYQRRRLQSACRSRSSDWSGWIESART